ncbi:MAG: hypothetical protein DWC07_08260 [Candidatus Poseidoniales archaeon]|nr:MAG: hypothetical protein DWC07_08260 [Candidatus Poseidoniales archaeon]
MSVLLDADRNTAPQSHIDELTRRVTLVFLVVAALTLMWFTQVDRVLSALMDHLAPCAGDCLNIYEPAQWSVVRWMAAVLLATLSSLPLMAFNAFRFAKPGLMQTERRALGLWLVATMMFTFGGVLVLLYSVLPAVYQTGYIHHIGIGLEAQYSAVQLLTFAGYVVTVWMTAVLVWTTTVILGRMGWLTASTASLWRWRTYGVAALVLVATAPETGRSVVLPTLGIVMLINEALGHRWWNLLPTMRGELIETFDSMGARRRQAIIDCSCEGANAFGGLLEQRSEASIRVNGLCTSSVEREKILQFVVVAKLTDVVVTGCNTASCPSLFKENLQSLRCNFSGMDLMGLASHRGDPSYVHPHELEAAIIAATPLSHPGEVSRRVKHWAAEQHLSMVQLNEELWSEGLSPLLIEDGTGITLLPNLNPASTKTS